MCDASIALVEEGVTLPARRLMGQCLAALSIAEADEPELSGCGWPALHTESLRRMCAGLESALRASPLEDPFAARIYDVYRKARDLIETLEVYSVLAFADDELRRCPVVTPEGPGPLAQILEDMLRAQRWVADHRVALTAEGLHPMVPQRLEVVVGELRWALAVQASTVAELNPQASRLAQLKARIFQQLGRLNHIGRLAYRHDAAHRARYNMEILDCRQLAVSAPAVERSPSRVHSGTSRANAAR